MKMVLDVQTEPQTPNARTGKLMVTVACPDAEHARRLATVLVEERLAACVQIVPGIESIYRWKGAIETASETLLLVKTAQTKWDALVAAVQRLHPYEVPEILAVPIACGLDSYLDWMDGELNSGD